MGKWYNRLIRNVAVLEIDGEIEARFIVLLD
jgi:hypothetical protein